MWSNSCGNLSHLLLFKYNVSPSYNIWVCVQAYVLTSAEPVKPCWEGDRRIDSKSFFQFWNVVRLHCWSHQELLHLIWSTVVSNTVQTEVLLFNFISPITLLTCMDYHTMLWLWVCVVNGQCQTDTQPSALHLSEPLAKQCLWLFLSWEQLSSDSLFLSSFNDLVLMTLFPVPATLWRPSWRLPFPVFHHLFEWVQTIQLLHPHTLFCAQLFFPDLCNWEVMTETLILAFSLQSVNFRLYFSWW